MQLVLISGLAGAGKSTALNILEDSDYLCIDNLPAQLLLPLIHLYDTSDSTKKIAIGIDTRSYSTLQEIPETIKTLTILGIDLKLIFLDTKTEVLIKRFSETRRKHPLADHHRTITDCINLEHHILAPLAEIAHRIDTSDMKANDLRRVIKTFVEVDTCGMNVILQSFGFKYGLPIDSDFVFDVRCLPNPHYDHTISDFNGTEEPIIQFLAKQAPVGKMINNIYQLLSQWLEAFSNDNRTSLTISIGCTGGKHRSVYITECLAKLIQQLGFQTIIRHRQLDN